MIKKNRTTVYYCLLTSDYKTQLEDTKVEIVPQQKQSMLLIFTSFFLMSLPPHSLIFYTPSSFLNLMHLSLYRFMLAWGLAIKSQRSQDSCLIFTVA